MRNLGIEPAFLRKARQVLEPFPYYKHKKIDGYVILCAYAKYLECYRPKTGEFAVRFSEHFGAHPDQIHDEFVALKELFSHPSIWPNLLRFAMAGAGLSAAWHHPSPWAPSETTTASPSETL